MCACIHANVHTLPHTHTQTHTALKPTVTRKTSRDKHLPQFPSLTAILRPFHGVSSTMSFQAPRSQKKAAPATAIEKKKVFNVSDW